MATVARIDPGYASYFKETIEICSHCERPLCPDCLNHTSLISKVTDTWECSNPDCRLEFDHYNG